MAETAWPFMVTRGRKIGYRVILAPKFLIDSGAVKALAEMAEYTELPSDTAAERKIHLPTHEPFLLIYRRFKPHARDIGLPSDAPLVDQAGREFWATEGIILQPALARPTRDLVAREDMDRAHHDALNSLRRLWEQDDWHAPEPSTAFAPTPSEHIPPQSTIPLIQVTAFTPTTTTIAPPTHQHVHADNNRQPRVETRSPIRASIVALTVGAVAAVALIVALQHRDTHSIPQPGFVASLGLFSSTPPTGAPGAVVSCMEAESPAADAGIKPGDRIIMFAGQPIRSSDQLVNDGRATHPGNTVTIKYVRGSITTTTTVTIPTTRPLSSNTCASIPPPGN